MPSNSLEQEAMDRVRRMYSSFDNRRPRGNITQSPHPEPNREPKKPASKTIPTTERSAEPRHNDIAPKNANGMLEILMKDQDQSLILLLLVLLMKDGADMNLMLALIYILL